MRRFRGIVAVIGAVIACSAITVSVTSTPAGAFSCSGVAVIVDMSAFGGSVERGCAANPGTGLDALHQAGFDTAGTTRWGDRFVCRIDGKPGDQACRDTPPPNASWSYYHAASGSTSDWTFSNLGAADTHPPAGSIEAWAFGNRARPSVAPSGVFTGDPPPPTTPPPTSGGGNGGGGGHNSGGGNGGGGQQQTGGTTARPTSTGTTPKIGDAVAATPKGGEVVVGGVTTTTTKAAAAQAKAKAAAKKKSDSKQSTTTTSPDAVRIIDRTASSKPGTRSDSGSPLPAIIAIVLIAAAATGGILFARSRRQRVS